MAARMLVVVLAMAAVLFSSVSAQAEMKDRTATTRIVVHHSATASGNVETFRQYHRSQGWDDVGYHFVITNGTKGDTDGQIQVGRPIEKVGAHAKGRNADSVGVCLVAIDEFTGAQKEALVKLLVGLCKKYGISPSTDTIQRHHEQCPGTGLDLGDIIARVKAKM